MADTKYPMTRVSPSTFEWLKERAERNHRTIVGEIDSVREIVEIYENNLGGRSDVLPHPEDAEPVLTLEPCRD